MDLGKAGFIPLEISKKIAINAAKTSRHEHTYTFIPFIQASKMLHEEWKNDAQFRLDILTAKYPCLGQNDIEKNVEKNVEKAVLELIRDADRHENPHDYAYSTQVLDLLLFTMHSVDKVTTCKYSIYSLHNDTRDFMISTFGLSPMSTISPFTSSPFMKYAYEAIKCKDDAITVYKIMEAAYCHIKCKLDIELFIGNIFAFALDLKRPKVAGMIKTHPILHACPDIYKALLKKQQYRCKNALQDDSVDLYLWMMYGLPNTEKDIQFMLPRQKELNDAYEFQDARKIPNGL